MEKNFITVTPDSGTGNATVTVVASENSGQDERSTSISISGGTMTRTLSINQEANPVTLEVSPTSLEFDPNGGLKQIQITCNTNWTIENSNPQLININPTSGTGNSSVNVIMMPNAAGDELNLSFTVKAGAISKTVSVKQTGVKSAGRLRNYNSPFTEVNMLIGRQEMLPYGWNSIGDFSIAPANTLTIKVVIKTDSIYQSTLSKLECVQYKTIGSNGVPIAYKTGNPPSANFSGQWSRTSGIPSRFTVVTTRQASLGEIEVQFQLIGAQVEDEGGYSFRITFKDPETQASLTAEAGFTITVTNQP